MADGFKTAVCLSHSVLAKQLNTFIKGFWETCEKKKISNLFAWTWAGQGQGRSAQTGTRTGT
jgi:hypothetical protein